MKTTLISIFFIISLVGCKEEMGNDLKTNVIQVTLDGTELYEYKIADAIPTEGGYEIRKQADNYQTSKMTWGTYNYQAQEGYKGVETVEIVLTGSSGDDNFKDYDKWTFEITIE